MSDLVRRLCEDDHRIEVVVRPEKTIQALKECLDRKYVHIRFSDTKGGTELGVTLDLDSSDLQQADFEHQTGILKLAGDLTLDYIKCRCIAEVDVKTFVGRGHLEAV